MEPITGKTIYPLAIVLAAIAIIEIAMTLLYPKLQTDWERVPVLTLILAVPIAIVAAFIYLWIRKPGHLYPPSEFGGTTDEALRLKFMAMCSPEWGTRIFGRDPEAGDEVVVLPRHRDT